MERLLRPIALFALVLTGAFVVFSIVRPHGLLLDFANFYDAGSKARAGAFDRLYDPMAEIAGAPPLGHMTFFSAPITAFLYAPMAALPPRTALLAFKIAGAAALILGLVLLHRQFAPFAAASRRERWAFDAAFSLGVLLFQPFWTVFRVGGQTTPFVFLLSVLALVWFTRGAQVAPAAAFAALLLVKPVFAPAALLLFLVGGWRFRITALALVAAVAALSFWLLGTGPHLEFLRVVRGEASTLLPPWFNSDPFSWIEALFAEPGVWRGQNGAPGEVAGGARQVVSALRLGAAVLLVVLLWRRVGRGPLSPADRHDVFVTGLMVSLVLSPVVWAHYLSVLFVIFVEVVATRRHQGRAVLAAAWAAVVLALAQNLLVIGRLERASGFDTRVEVIAIALLKSLPALLFLGVLLAGATRRAAWREVFAHETRISAARTSGVQVSGARASARVSGARASAAQDEPERG